MVFTKPVPALALPHIGNVRVGSNPEVRGHFKIGPLCGLERTLKREMSGYRPRAVVLYDAAEPPLLANSGHKNERLKSEISQIRLYGNFLRITPNQPGLVGITDPVFALGWNAFTSFKSLSESASQSRSS